MIVDCLISSTYAYYLFVVNKNQIMMQISFSTKHGSSIYIFHFSVDNVDS